MHLVVDYLGYRLVAMPVVPLCKDSIIYGSNDGAQTVHAESEPFNALMRRAAAELHLAPHAVGGKVLCSAGDLEGHIAQDGR